MALKKKPLLIILVVVVVGIVGLLSFRRLNNGDGTTITLSGNIELTEVNISFKAPGKLAELAVREGDGVKKGMVLARLDQEQLLHQRARAHAAVAAAESGLVQVQTAIEYQSETVQGQVAMRQSELGMAEARLKELLAGSRSQEIEQARAAVDSARTEHERAVKDWERAQRLYQNEDISTAQYDQFKTRYESAVAALKQSQERLALVVEGPRKETIEAAGAQVSQAKAGVRLAEATGLELKRRQQELHARRADVDRARAERAIIESQLEDTTALCPIDGVVLSKAAEVGEVLAAGATVLTVGDLDHPWLRGYINETDLGRVKLGAQVRVTTDSFPDKVYWGRVTFISSEAEFTPKQIQTPEERVKLVYRIKIEIDNPARELKSNMPADAQIMLNAER